ncbi:MAG: S-adenosylmethionine:tRNA ribosyltransferase-isomerase [Planctomycetota bacterium]|nr:S-adenosylmethionine:tRNA ribosyltransferase-isomerase [Planctomycetota bacterium]
MCYCTTFPLPRSINPLNNGRKLNYLLFAYGEAVRLGYRFYSYGDAMLILPAK